MIIRLAWKQKICHDNIQCREILVLKTSISRSSTFAGHVLFQNQNLVRFFFIATDILFTCPVCKFTKKKKINREEINLANLNLERFWFYKLLSRERLFYRGRFSVFLFDVYSKNLPGFSSQLTIVLKPLLFFRPSDLFFVACTACALVPFLQFCEVFGHFMLRFLLNVQLIELICKNEIQ